MSSSKTLAVADHRARAQRRLPRFLFDYMDGGAVDEVTLRRNVDALQAIELRQRVLRDVSDIRLETTLFGRPQRMPVALAPIGLAGMLARRGEVQAARAAEGAGVPFCLSTVSACSLGEVVRGVTAPIWFQLYMIRDRGFMRELLAEAAAANCSALVFTVDMPVAGIRYRDSRSGLSGAPGPLGQLRRLAQAVGRPAWAWDVGVRGRPHSLGNVARAVGAKTALDDFFRWVGANFDPSIHWRDLDFIRSEWRGPLILKGILDPADAREAAEVGADGLVVSNHGGRQLDGAAATAKALPAVADAVGDRLTVLADGGVRSGLDVVRMLALGAKGVLLGRAWAYALGGGGGAGVARLLAQIEAEMRVAMALTGATSIERIDHSILG